MGGMSASDAAPLPRLGEVFFDVRGNSRSMRLSWYADTGVAVLSIWQGGMCTGTFRLAIADLPRMVETLQRGPGGQRPEWDPPAPGQVFAPVPRVATGQAQAMEPTSGQGGAEQDDRARSAQYDTQYLTEVPGGPRTGAGGPPRHRTAPPGYPPEPAPGRPSVPPASRPAVPSHRAVPPEYLAEPPDEPRTGATARPSGPPDYLPAPPDHRTRAPDHAASPPDYLAGPADYAAAPPAHRTEHLADLPGSGQPGPAGYGSALDAGRHSAAGATYPAAGADAPYPRGTGREAGYPDVLAHDPYLGGTGPMDYQGSSYPPGTSAPGHEDLPGPEAADYPLPYGGTVTDEILPGTAPDAAPYDQPPGRRRAASRHAAPDAPFD
jgi:hypothetical protein